MMRSGSPCGGDQGRRQGAGTGLTGGSGQEPHKQAAVLHLYLPLASAGTYTEAALWQEKTKRVEADEISLRKPVLFFYVTDCYFI